MQMSFDLKGVHKKISQVVKKTTNEKHKQTATFSICQTDTALWEVKKKKKKKKHATPSDHPVVICALMQQLSKGRGSGRDAPSLTYSLLWLISRKARGAVQSHSLIGEHMSGPICHWLL